MSRAKRINEQPQKTEVAQCRRPAAVAQMQQMDSVRALRCHGREAQCVASVFRGVRLLLNRERPLRRRRGRCGALWTSVQQRSPKRTFDFGGPPLSVARAVTSPAQRARAVLQADAAFGCG